MTEKSVGNAGRGAGRRPRALALPPIVLWLGRTEGWTQGTECHPQLTPARSVPSLASSELKTR